MATTFTRMLQRGATEAEILSSTDVPLAREIVTASDTGAFWIGNGVDAPSALPKQGPLHLGDDGLVTLPAGGAVPTVDFSTGELPAVVRTALARSLGDRTTPEGAAVADLAADLTYDETDMLYRPASGPPIPSLAQRESAGVGLAIGDPDLAAPGLLVRSPETTERLLVARDHLQVRQRFGVGTAPSSRTPFAAITRVDGSTLSADAKAADKCGVSINTSFVGGFTNEGAYGASNPSFLFGVNLFNIFGTKAGAGDLAGINTIYGTLAEAHISAKDAAVNTLNGLMVETSTNSSVDEVRGINVVGHRLGDDAGSSVVQTAVGVNITSPTMGVKKYALRTQGSAPSEFGGDVNLSLDPSAPRLLHTYSGEVRSKRVSVGGATVTEQGGVNVASVGMLTVKSNADSDVVASFQGRGSQSGDIIRMGRDTAATTRFDGRARLIFQSNTALATGDLTAGEGGMWVDNSSFGNERMNFRGKATNGTLRPTVSVPLNPIGIAAAATDAATTQALVNDLRQKLISLGWFV